MAQRALSPFRARHSVYPLSPPPRGKSDPSQGRPPPFFFGHDGPEPFPFSLFGYRRLRAKVFSALGSGDLLPLLLSPFFFFRSGGTRSNLPHPPPPFFPCSEKASGSLPFFLGKCLYRERVFLPPLPDDKAHGSPPFFSFPLATRKVNAIFTPSFLPLARDIAYFSASPFLFFFLLGHRETGAPSMVLPFLHPCACARLVCVLSRESPFFLPCSG